MRVVKEAIKKYFRENVSVIAGGLLLMNGSGTAYHIHCTTR